MTTTEFPEIAFVGGGNMAAAIAGGLVAARLPPVRLRIAERDLVRRQALQQRFPRARVVETPAEAVAGAGAVVLAVKPQQMAAALAGLRLAAQVTVVSIAAGLRVARLRGWLDDHAQLVRCMPNTPALVGAGASGLYADARVTPHARRLAEAILRCVGDVCWLEQEALLDAVTAVSGSGPAYFFLLTEALAAAGARLGLSPEVAQRLARQTLIGAGRLLQATDEDAGELRARVTSPGGTTEAALHRLAVDGFEDIVAAAVTAAAARAAELGDGNG